MHCLVVPLLLVLGSPLAAQSPGEIARENVDQILDRGVLKAGGWVLAGSTWVEHEDPDFAEMEGAEQRLELIVALATHQFPDLEQAGLPVSEGDSHALLLPSLLESVNDARFLTFNGLVAAGAHTVLDDALEGGRQVLVMAMPEADQPGPTWNESFAAWLGTNHEGDFNSAVLVLEFGSAEPQRRALTWVAEVLSSQRGKGAAEPLTGLTYAHLDCWEASSLPDVVGLQGLQLLSARPGHPDGLQQAATSFESIGMRILASYYSDPLQTPLLPIGEGLLLMQAEEAERLSVYLGDRPIGPAVQGAARFGGRILLAPQSGKGVVARAGGRLRVAAAIFRKAPGSQNAMDLARALAGWGFPAHAYGLASASVQASKGLSLGDLSFLHLLHVTCSAEPISAENALLLGTKIEGLEDAHLVLLRLLGTH